MKKLFISILFLVASFEASAQCDMGDPSCFPAKTTVSIQWDAALNLAP